MKTKNKLYATGKVIKLGRNKQGYLELVVLVKDIRESFIHFALKKPLDPDIGVGDYVDIEGRMRAVNYKDAESGKWLSNQYCVADVVEKAKTALEVGTGYKGRFYAPGHFDLYIIGSVASTIMTGDRWAKMSIKTAGVTPGDRDNYIVTNYLTKGQLPGITKFRRGDQVAVHCRMTTPQKKIRGSIVNFEDLIVEDIVLIEKGDGEVMPEMEDMSA